MNKKRINCNYEIIKAKKVDKNTEIVMGFNPISNFYVCWICEDGNNYNWGTYSEDYQKVLNNYQERIKKNTNLLYS